MNGRKEPAGYNKGFVFIRRSGTGHDTHDTRHTAYALVMTKRNVDDVEFFAQHHTQHVLFISSFEIRERREL